MKNAKKIVALLLCAVLLVGASVMGTLAYLTDNDDVTNTFTIGKVDIKLEEKPLNVETGEQVEGDAVTGIQNIKLIPGREIEKEPFITVEPGSENCWLMVKIVNELAAAGTITMAGGWSEVGTNTGIYVYNAECEVGDVVPVFTAFTVHENLEDLAEFDNKTIKVTAYAVQKEGFDNATDAWNATFGA